MPVPFTGLENPISGAFPIAFICALRAFLLCWQIDDPPYNCYLVHLLYSPIRWRNIVRPSSGSRGIWLQLRRFGRHYALQDGYDELVLSITGHISDWFHPSFRVDARGLSREEHSDLLNYVVEELEHRLAARGGDTRVVRSSDDTLFFVQDLHSSHPYTYSL